MDLYNHQNPPKVYPQNPPVVYTQNSHAVYPQNPAHIVYHQNPHIVYPQNQKLKLILCQPWMNSSSPAISPEATEMPVGNVVCLHLNDPNVCNRPAVAKSIYVIEQVKPAFKIMVTAHF